MKKLAFISGLLIIGLQECVDLPEYPIEPIINFENFFLYTDSNSLGQEVLYGRVDFSFTDGDGNLGFEPLPDTLAEGLPDSLRYNLFFHTYEIQDGVSVKIDEKDGGYLKYVIPYIDNAPLRGTASVTIEYPFLVFDTIFYTFYCYDRDFHKSNTDTTYIQVLSH